MTPQGAGDGTCGEDLRGDLVLDSVSGCGIAEKQLKQVSVSFSSHVQFVQLVDSDPMFDPSKHSLVVEQPVVVSVGSAAALDQSSLRCGSGDSADTKCSSSSVSGDQGLGDPVSSKSAEDKRWSPRMTMDKWWIGLEGRRHVAERPFGAANPPCVDVSAGSATALDESRSRCGSGENGGTKQDSSSSECTDQAEHGFLVEQQPREVFTFPLVHQSPACQPSRHNEDERTEKAQ